MSYTIAIRQLALFAWHGVYPEEKSIGQRFFIDIDFTIDDERALEADDIEASVSYADVVAVATDIFTTQRFHMIETAASRLADAILGQFPLIELVKVSVHKPAAPVQAIVGNVFATVERRRHG